MFVLQSFLILKLINSNYLILGLQNFQKILLILVPEEPTIPSNVCEELIIWALSVYRINVSYETKAQYFFFWLLCKYYADKES